MRHISDHVFPEGLEQHSRMKTTLYQRITELCLQHGGLRSAARELEIDVAYLSRLRNGAKREPSREVLRKLGLRRHVYYTIRERALE